MIVPSLRGGYHRSAEEKNLKKKKKKLGYEKKKLKKKGETSVPLCAFVVRRIELGHLVNKKLVLSDMVKKSCGLLGSATGLASAG